MHTLSVTDRKCEHAEAANQKRIELKAAIRDNEEICYVGSTIVEKIVGQTTRVTIDRELHRIWNNFHDST